MKEVPSGIEALRAAVVSARYALAEHDLEACRDSLLTFDGLWNRLSASDKEQMLPLRGWADITLAGSSLFCGEHCAPRKIFEEVRERFRDGRDDELYVCASEGAIDVVYALHESASSLNEAINENACLRGYLIERYPLLAHIARTHLVEANLWTALGEIEGSPTRFVDAVERHTRRCVELLEGNEASMTLREQARSQLAAFLSGPEKVRSLERAAAALRRTAPYGRAVPDALILLAEARREVGLPHVRTLMRAWKVTKHHADASDVNEDGANAMDYRRAVPRVLAEDLLSLGQTHLGARVLREFKGRISENIARKWEASPSRRQHTAAVTSEIADILAGQGPPGVQDGPLNPLEQARFRRRAMSSEGSAAFPPPRQSSDSLPTRLDYFVGKRTGWLILYRGEEVRAFSIEVKGEDVAHALDECAGEAFPSEEALHTLSVALLPQEVSRLLRSEPEIAIIPDAPLWYVPFAALTLPGSGVPMGLDKEISLRHGHDLRDMESLRAVDKAIVIDVGEFGARALTGGGAEHERLPNSSAETKAVLGAYEHFGLDPVRVSTVITPRGKLLSSLQEAAVIHIAGHGNPTEEERGGFLIPVSAAQGLDWTITTQDIASRRIDARVVVLSACLTLRGPEKASEGPRGATYWFLEAGAQSVVCSLTKISDYASAVYMPVLHGFLAKGCNVASAVMKANAHMASRDFPLAEWACFQVVGDGRASLGLQDGSRRDAKFRS